MNDAAKLQDEYAKLVEGLQEAADNEDAFMSNPSAYDARRRGGSKACIITHTLTHFRV